MNEEQFEQELIERLSEFDTKTKQGIKLLIDNIDFFSSWIDHSELNDEDIAWVKHNAVLSDDVFIKILSAYIIAYTSKLE